MKAAPPSRRTLLQGGAALLTGLLTPCAAPADPKRAVFRVGKTADGWAFLPPGGAEPWVSLGVCCVEQGARAGGGNTPAAEYAALRHYPDTGAWADDAVRRLRGWNFNSIGGWSDPLLRPKMPYAEVLHLGAYSQPNVPWADLWGPEIAETFDQTARKLVTPLRNDPNLLGYFTDNEIGWWDETIFRYHYQAKGDSKTRQVLMRLMRSHYGGDLGRLGRDWDAPGATAWDHLTPDRPLYRREGGQAWRLIDRFLLAFADRYYRLCRDAIRRYDPDHLLLGDRYAQFYCAPVARACARYNDVVSLNYGANWPTGALSPFVLDGLYKLTGKPILISEYYFAAMENRSGNQNTRGGFPTVQTQAERAQSVARYLGELAARPYLVGAHWFQYFDEPTGGRADGENYNMGLVDIHNVPYEAVTAAFTKVQADFARLRRAARLARPPDALAATGENAAEALLNWNVAQTWIKPRGAGVPFGDLFVYGDRDELLIAVHFADYVDLALYRDRVMPQSERATLTFTLAGGPERLTAAVRMGAGQGTRMESATPAVTLVHTKNEATRTTVILRVDRSRLPLNSPIRLSVRLVRHGGAQAITWQKTWPGYPAA